MASYPQEGPTYDEDGLQRTPRDRGQSLAHRQDLIDKHMAALDNEVDRIAERLQAVLGPERPSPALDSRGPSEEPGSDLSRFLEATAARIHSFAARLSYLTDRIDL